MAVITTGAHPKALWPGIKSWFGKVYNEHPKEWPDLVTVGTSDKAYEELVQDVGFNFAQIKAQGMPLVNSADQQGYVTRLVNVTYALGYIVTLEELQDDLYEAVSSTRSQTLAFSMNQTKENVVANIYNRAFNSSYTGADGVELCSTVHPRITGGTYSNEMATPADLSEDSLEDAIIDIMGFQNDRGMPVSFMPRSLHVARQQWFNANRILKSVYQPGTANNDINVIKATNALPMGVKLNHYFSNANKWFVRTTGCTPGTGLVLLQRMAVALDQDNEFSTKNACASAIERFTVGWGDPRDIYGVDVT